LNHPANLERVYLGLAMVRGVPPAQLAGTAEANFLRLFGELQRVGVP
jgi:Tat protein secretion system quality control protein TatD with DNase activity